MSSILRRRKKDSASSRTRSRARSLLFRFVAGATVTIVLGLLIGALLLGSIYEGWRQRQINDFMRFTLDRLVISFDVDQPRRLRFPFFLQDSGFLNQGSGFYWQITQNRKMFVWSPSLGSPNIPSPDSVAIKTGGEKLYYFYEAKGPHGKRLWVATFKLNIAEGRKPYVFLVAQPLTSLQDEIESFRLTLLISMGILGLILIVALILLVHFGLAPLRRIPPSLAAIRSGNASHLTGEFPTEIQPLADEINALLDHNSQIVERARTHVGNLAHALKTPLAVLQNEATENESELADKIEEQATIMRQQVEHHLARARVAAQAGILGARTSIMPILEGLARTLERIHQDKGIKITVDGDQNLAFRGEKQDFEEALGNLVDNACKFAALEVQLHASQRVTDKGERLFIAVEDDGPGLTPSQRRTAIKRGMRIDETAPGSGLGLSIVSDIAQMYGGRFELDEAPAGGLSARLELPAASSSTKD